MFKKILVANRGEIAIRIIRCCREMNIETVAVYSTADEDSLHTELATEKVCIGGARAADSYLNMKAIISAALATGCEAIHPGYGFLSENSDFARLCESQGLVFIGPSGDVIDKMGNKAAARDLMTKEGVPVVPGSDGTIESTDDAVKCADRIGYPVLIKASAGGGGRGMRKAFSHEETAKAFNEARAESKACFGSQEMYIEKLILGPRHIEVQILADTKGNIVYLGERDCSIQRKNQKMIEESPSIAINDEQRRALGETAVAAARAAGYTSAGTVEFVVDADGKFYFIEMNTRIQVEHPVTEMVTGIDLIKEQIKIAAGSSLSYSQQDIHIKGHSIECRINAENPAKNFSPECGVIPFVNFPGGPGVRVDTMLYPGYEMKPFYDSMVAKIIVHAPTRLEAIRRMRRALEELITEGIETTGDFDYLVLHHPDFVKGRYNTGFIEEHMKEIQSWDR